MLSSFMKATYTCAPFQKLLATHFAELKIWFRNHREKKEIKLIEHCLHSNLFRRSVETTLREVAWLRIASAACKLNIGCDTNHRPKGGHAILYPEALSVTRVCSSRSATQILMYFLDSTKRRDDCPCLHATMILDIENDDE